MNNKFNMILLILLLLVTLLNGDDVSSLTSKDLKIANFKNSINSCPGGLIFGVYSINYERMLKPKHGLVGRFDYENISEKYSGDKFEAQGLAFIANYRRHFKPSMHSFYLGTYARYRVYDGTGEDGYFECLSVNTVIYTGAEKQLS